MTRCRVVGARAQGSPSGAEVAGGSVRAQAAVHTNNTSNVGGARLGVSPGIAGASAQCRVVSASVQGSPRGAEGAGGTPGRKQRG